MNQAEFDRFADAYYKDLARSVAVSGERPEFFAEYKVEDVSRLVRRFGLHGASILDFGSGIGSSVPYFRKWFPKSTLICADASKRSLEISRERFPGAERYLHVEGSTLLIESDSVDIVFSACVFHHIAPKDRQHWLQELHRVARPGGICVVFEHNPLNPLTVRAVNQCPFDENAVLLQAKELREHFREAGWLGTRVEYRLFFPGGLSFLRPLERLAGKICLGAQYYTFGRKADWLRGRVG